MCCHRLGSPTIYASGEFDPMPISEEEKKAFLQRVESFNRYWPTLESILDRAFYSRLTLPDEHGITVGCLGKQCADTFEEIRFVCTNGYGLAGTKLLRGLYERAVTAAYFAKKHEAAGKFLDAFAIDLGKLMHRHQKFAEANGEDPNKILPAEVLQRTEEDYKRAKETEERCDRCGAPKGRVDVFSMAQAAIPALVPYYGLCYLEPTFHVHCTWYSVLEGVKVTAGENHIDFHPHLEGGRALKTLQLSHFVILHAAETQNAYFHLLLEEEIAKRWAEYRPLWET
jgi:hypothetical protein